MASLGDFRRITASSVLATLMSWVTGLLAPEPAEAFRYCSGGTFTERFYNAVGLAGIAQADPVFEWIPSPNGGLPATFKTSTANPDLNPGNNLSQGWFVTRSRAKDEGSCEYLGNLPIGIGKPTLILTPGNALDAAVLDTPLSGDGGILVGQAFTFIINNPNSTHTGFIKTEGTGKFVNLPGRLGGSGTTNSTIINQGVVFVGPDHGMGNAGAKLTVGGYSESFRSTGDAAPRLEVDVAGKTTDQLVVRSDIPDNGLRGEVHVAGTPLPGMTYVVLQGPAGSHEPQNFNLRFDSYVLQNGAKVAFNVDGDPTTTDFTVIESSGGAFQTAASKDRRHSRGTKQVAKLLDKYNSIVSTTGGTVATTAPPAGGGTSGGTTDPTDPPGGGGSSGGTTDPTDPPGSRLISALSGGTTGISEKTAVDALGKGTTKSSAVDFVRVHHEVISQPTADTYLNALRSLEAQPYGTNQSVVLEAMERLRADAFAVTQGNNVIRLSTEEQICLDENRGSKSFMRDMESCKNLRTVSKPLPWSAVISVSNTEASLDGTEQLASIDYSIFQSLYGLQYDLSSNWAFGAGFGYGRTKLSDYEFAPVSIDSDTYSGIVWGIYTPTDAWKFSGLLGYSNFDYESRRKIQFGAINRTARADWDVDGFTAALSVQYEWILNPSDKLPSTADPDPNRNAMRLKPRALLSYGTANQDAFTETGAGSVNLALDSHTADSFITGLGLTLETPVQLNERNRLIPRFTVAWEHDFNGDEDKEHELSASFAEVPALGTKDVVGQNRGSDDLDVGMAFELESGENVSLYGSVLGSFWSNGTELNYGGGLRVRW
jgi:outer membrane autotransporter protein